MTSLSNSGLHQPAQTLTATVAAATQNPRGRRAGRPDSQKAIMTRMIEYYDSVLDHHHDRVQSVRLGSKYCECSQTRMAPGLGISTAGSTLG